MSTADSKRISEDFQRFIRHESMQMNVTQDEVIEIIKTAGI